MTIHAAPACETTNSRVGSLSTSQGSLTLSMLILFAFLMLACSSAFAQGSISKLTIKSSVMGEDRAILVRTPQGYDTSKNSYPVLYMTDGDAHMAHTASTVEFLARNGRIPEMIVVGIPNTDRTRDLTPTKATGENTTQFPTAGGADKFLKFIETELIPEIERRYRVQPYRILAGHSFGGLFVIHTMITHPELFQSYIAVSPSLQWSDQATLKRAEEFLKGRKEWNATLFTSLGNEPGDIGEAFVLFKDMLTKHPIKGFGWEWQQLADEDHGSVVLRSHYLGLRKVYEGWQMPRDPTTGAVVGGLKGAEEHYRRLTQKFGFSIPVPETLVNQIGYQFLQGGNPDEAIATFKRNVELYPASANVYDSLAEAYEKNGHLELAIPLYEKAQTLSQQNDDPNATVFKANYDRASAKMKQSETAKPKQ